MLSAKVYVLSLTILIFTTCVTYGQDPSHSDLAKQAQYPIADLISLPLQNNTNINIGPDDETKNILNIQPVWPFSLSENCNLITRTIFPVISQPDVLTGGEGRINGLSDTTFTAFLSPKNSGKLTWESVRYCFSRLQRILPWAATNGAPDRRS
jgi:hypothetical protein